MIDLIVTFLSGAAIEAFAVLWVHYSERNMRLHLFIVSLMLGLSNVTGMSGALTGWAGVTAYVLGYGIGPQIGISLKKRYLQDQHQ